LIDRTSELDRATATLQAAKSVQCFGEAGVGKTALVRQVANHSIVKSLGREVVCLPTHRPLIDLLQAFYDIYYLRGSYQPDIHEIRRILREKRSIVVADDLDLPREDVEELLNAAPNCTFLMAAPECLLFGEGTAVGLKGLPLDAALALVERELGRPLVANERAAAKSLHTSLEGHPLRLLQAVVSAREGQRPLAEIAREIQRHPKGFVELVLASLSGFAKEIVGILGAISGASVGAEHVAPLSGIPDAVPALKELEKRYLVESHSPRYSLVDSLGTALQSSWDLTRWRERALQYFINWAAREPSATGRVQGEIDSILNLHAWAADTERWRAVLDLGRAADDALLLSGRWAAWAAVLDRNLQAARAIGDRFGEGWCLHQLGTRALGLGEATLAHALLSDALALRESIGDEPGASVTRRNMRYARTSGDSRTPVVLMRVPGSTDPEPVFLYDAYISYVDQQPDRDWVWSELVPRLTAAGLRVAVSGNSDDPVVYQVTSMETGLREAKRTVLILSDAYLADRMAEFEKVVSQTFAAQEGIYRIVPVTIEAIDRSVLPVRLSPLGLVDLVHSARAERQLQRLIAALQSPVPR
jgi:hypothetical protein